MQVIPSTEELHEFNPQNTLERYILLFQYTSTRYFVIWIYQN